MNTEAFKESLVKDGFAAAVSVTRDANGEAALHEHEFEAKALIVQGWLDIRVGNSERRYEVGDIFHLRAGEPHSERYGPDGVTYLVGRKQ